MTLAAGTVLIYSLILTLAPVVRAHSWETSIRWAHWIGSIVWLADFIWLHRLTQRLAPERDPYILPVMAMLSGIGLLTIWRLDSMELVLQGFGFRQTIWLLAGSAVFSVGLRFSFFIDWLKRYKYVWLLAGFLLMGLTFLFGIYPSGTGPRLWLTFGFAYLQPSEILKLLLIVYLSAYLSEHLSVSLDLFQILAPTFLLIIAATVLLLAQRDLGTAIIFIMVYFSILYLAIGKRRILLSGAVVILIAAITSYIFLSPVRNRIDTWINPWKHPESSSYQVVQSLIAVASGGVFGSGPGLGNPRVVPVAHSDFIFSSISEELGLIGTSTLILLYAVLIIRGMITSIHSRRPFYRYLSGGIAVYFGLQAILIMAGNLRLLPLTGVTLPFVSYGGSSLLVAFISGLILLYISGQSGEGIYLLEHPATYRLLSGGLLGGLLAVTLVNAFYGIGKSNELLSRTDNPRWAINDLYVQRGRIVDRDNQVLAHTTGKAGAYQRELLYSSLSSTVGYSDPKYGQGGIEASEDLYLRGLKGIPSSTIFWQNFLYNQPPAGLDVRLTLSSEIQTRADQLMESHKGALVMLNPKSGEVFAMSSQPTFDANQLNEEWEFWKQDENARLINRVTQGQYPLGTILAPFLFTSYQSTAKPLPALPNTWDYRMHDGSLITCAVPPSNHTWSAAVHSGCPNNSILLGEALGINALRTAYQTWGFDQAQDLQLETAEVSHVQALSDQEKTALGSANFYVTPLQVALAASAFSANGYRPSPLLAMAVDTPTEGWVVLPIQKAQSTYPSDIVNSVAEAMTVAGEAYWLAVGSASTSEGPITWVIAGTAPAWKGAPLVLTLVIEENNAAKAMQIAADMIKSTMQ